MMDSPWVTSAFVATGVKLIWLAGVAERLLGAVDARLDVELAGGRDERGHVAGVQLGQRPAAQLVPDS